MISLNEIKNKQRRIFIKKDNEYLQLFSFNQKEDGSIYSSMPEFGNIKWMSIVKQNGQVELATTKPLENQGKLSIHGTGMATYRAHSENKGHQLIIKGNFLLNGVADKIGVRHLFTSFFSRT